MTDSFQRKSSVSSSRNSQAQDGDSDLRNEKSTSAKGSRKKSAKRAPKLPSYCCHKTRNKGYSRVVGKFIYFEGAYNSPESLEQYNRLCAEIIASGTVTASLPSFQERDANDITIIELCDRFLTWADRHYRHADGTKTGADVRHIEACKPLVRLYGRLEVREFSPVKLKTVRQVMIDSGLCRSEVNARIRCIRQFFRWGVENELVPVEVTQALQMVRGLQAGRTTAREPEPIGPVPDDAIRVVLPHLSPIIVDMIGVQQLTGMRPQDIVGLCAREIHRDGDVWGYRPQSHKTAHLGKRRGVAIGPQAQRILQPYLDARVDALDVPLFSPQDAARLRKEMQRRLRKTRVQPSQHNRSKSKPQRTPGKGYTVSSYRRAIHRACDKAGIPHWSPNRLRHATATVVTDRFSLAHAKEVLGHSSIQTTERWYVAPLPEKAIEVAREIG